MVVACCWFVTLLLIYLADLVASIREDGGDIGLLGFSVQSLLPSEVVQPRLKEDKDGRRGMSSLFFMSLSASQLIMLLCVLVRVPPASVPSDSGGVSDGDLSVRPPLIDWGSSVLPES